MTTTFAPPKLCIDCQADISDSYGQRKRCESCVRRLTSQRNAEAKSARAKAAREANPRPCLGCATDLRYTDARRVRCYRCSRNRKTELYGAICKANRKAKRGAMKANAELMAREAAAKAARKIERLGADARGIGRSGVTEANPHKATMPGPRGCDGCRRYGGFHDDWCPAVGERVVS